MLETYALSKHFGGLRAVDGASLSVAAGTITGLIGPNGAGKTTLFAMISGFEEPTSGTVTFAGEDVTRETAHRRARRGIARTFQIARPFDGLTVRQNIAVGAHLHHASRQAALSKAEQVAHQVGLTPQIDRPASALTVAGRKRLELARALAIAPKLLLLDEVLAGLNPSEIRDMLPVLRGVRDSGITILMVEHVMQAIMSLCDVVHVLVQGAMIAKGTPDEIARNPRVIEAYLGAGAAKRLDAARAHA